MDGSTPQTLVYICWTAYYKKETSECFSWYENDERGRLLYWPFHVEIEASFFAQETVKHHMKTGSAVCSADRAPPSTSTVKIHDNQV